LWGDADKLARVFNNILKNALAYSYEDSVIDISAQQQDKNIMITFTNQGNLIPPQRLDTIFEKFYRLDAARSTNTGGAGLGLAIAKEIVKAHDGTISVESNKENTTFTVKLPL
jgi:two-component system sensor histidine kinase VanS